MEEPDHQTSPNPDSSARPLLVQSRIREETVRVGEGGKWQAMITRTLAGAGGTEESGSEGEP